MENRHKKTVTVSLILLSNDKKEILLQKRKNTGYMDGMYDSCCSGHVDEQETLKDALIREAKEEIGIDIDKEEIQLLSIIDAVEENYINFFFSIKKYKGTPSIIETNKCEELKWFKINEIPINTIPKVKKVLEITDTDIIYEERK